MTQDKLDVSDAPQETTHAHREAARSARPPRKHWTSLIAYAIVIDTERARTQEDLEHRSQEQDTQIQALLYQMDALRLNAKVQSWVNRATVTANTGAFIGMILPVTSYEMLTKLRLFRSTLCHPDNMSLLFCPHWPTGGRFVTYVCTGPPLWWKILLTSEAIATAPNFEELPLLLRTGILAPFEVIDLFNL